MSTKIHHGHRLADGTDLQAFLAALPAVMSPIRDRLDAARIIDKALTSIDEADRRGVARPAQPAAMALQKILAEEADPRNAHTVWGSWNEVELAYGTDPDTGRTMILIFAVENVYTEALRAMPQVEAYGYWNNSDRPAGVSEREWEDRRQAWARTLPTGVPADSMDSWELEKPEGRVEALLTRILSSDEELSRWAPDFNRARRLAINTYAEWLHATTGMDPIECAGPAFRADLDWLIFMIGPVLAPMTVELLTTGTGASGLYPIMDQVRAACEHVQDDD